jgi:hypothetical protein
MSDAILRPVTLSPELVGQRAPCNFFDENNNLLLRHGGVINKAVLIRLGNRRLFCDARQAARISNDNPLRALANAGETLVMLDAMVVAGNKVDVETCVSLAETLYSSWLLDPDACIGFVRMAFPGSPSVCQVMLAALFIAELGNAHAFTRHELIDLIGAALLMNLGSMALHDQMADVAGALPEKMRSALIEHPIYAAEILLDIGVPEVWSRAVSQHHENLDGSGYPSGFGKGIICLEARMLRVVDVFAARLRSRRGRGPQYWSIVHAKDLPSLTEYVFGSDLDSLDLSLARMLMGRLGTFPPGSLVRLSNGETGIVNRRAGMERDATMLPREVLVFVDVHGRILSAPRVRRIGHNDHRIQGYAHDEQRHLPAYDWAKIWGYHCT